MISANIQHWILHPEALNKDTLYELRTLVARYPYSQVLRLLYLKNLYLLHDVTFGGELRKAIVYVSDRRKLFYLIEGEKYTLQSRKKPVLQVEALLEAEPSLDRTLTLIDAFLATVPEEVSGQTDLDYSTDYTAYLLQSDEEEQPVEDNTAVAPKLRGQDLIDGFIEKSGIESNLRIMLPDKVEEVEEEQPQNEEPETSDVEEEEDDSCFTETLAKIYVKQKRYSKALEIIEKLSLKYPKKNAYFADQIRFLEKLIINAKSK
ncbi:tetratricopeptide repeat protein [Bacteroides sp.]